MNNNQKSSLDYPAPAMEDFAGNTILEVLQEKTADNSSSKYVLIKHDYYSSDSDHHRTEIDDQLLKCLLRVLLLVDLPHKFFVTYHISFPMQKKSRIIHPTSTDKETA